MPTSKNISAMPRSKSNSISAITSSTSTRSSSACSAKPDANSARLTVHHPRGDTVSLDEVMPGRRRRMKDDQRQQHIGSQDVPVLKGIRRRLVGRGELRHVEQAEEAAVVPLRPRAECAQPRPITTKVAR